MISVTKASLPAPAKSYRTIAMCLFVLAIVSVSQASAKADVITFELDPIQSQLPNGFRSVESNLVRFSASRAATLHIQPEVGQQWFFGTRGLAVEATPGFFMDFDVNVNSLSLWFGNDNIDTAPGDTAILRTFLDDVFVGETVVLLNRDGIINQQILFSGAVFNRASFHFSTERLVESVDNIEFTPVPEPATLALLGIGIAGIVARFRRRRDEV